MNNLICHPTSLENPNMAYIPNPKAHEIAPPKLAIDGKIEEGKVACLVRHLKAYADCPDHAPLERRSLTNELAFVPGCPR
jgi:hypothetical protein